MSRKLTAAALLPHHRRVLVELDHLTQPNGELCAYFRTIARGLEMDVREVRRIVRCLARKGLAEYWRGLWSDDGPAGGGYCITPAGRAKLKQEGR